MLKGKSSHLSSLSSPGSNSMAEATLKGSGSCFCSWVPDITFRMMNSSCACLSCQLNSNANIEPIALHQCLRVCLIHIRTSAFHCMDLCVPFWKFKRPREDGTPCPPCHVSASSGSHSSSLAHFPARVPTWPPLIPKYLSIPSPGSPGIQTSAMLHVVLLVFMNHISNGLLWRAHVPLWPSLQQWSLPSHLPYKHMCTESPNPIYTPQYSFS